MCREVARRQLRQHLQKFQVWSVLPAAYIRRWQWFCFARGAILGWRERCRKSAWRIELFQQGHNEKAREYKTNPGPRLKIDRFRAQHRRRKVRHGPAGLRGGHPRLRFSPSTTSGKETGALSNLLRRMETSTARA